MDLKSLRKEMMLSKKTDVEKSKVLQAILGTAQLIAKEDGNRETTSEDIVQAAKKEAKIAQQSKDSGAPYSERTFEITASFLPKMLSEEELSLHIKKIIEEKSIDSMKGMGTVMGTLKKEFKDTFDGKMANTIIRKILG
jgi:uncharacterized protein YqeY